MLYLLNILGFAYNNYFSVVCVREHFLITALGINILN